MPSLNSQVIALVGPTAVGKTAVAIELAQRLGAEVVSCDSMQVYQRMPVLSQVATAAQRAQATHHLVDCVEPTEPFSVGMYRAMASSLSNALLERGRRVLVVGGTGLYLKALTEGLCQAPPSDQMLRERLWGESRKNGNPALYHRLQSVDAAAASRIHPNDARRIIRALEVYTLTGRPLSEWWTDAIDRQWTQPMMVIGLDRERSELYRRINERVVHMVYEEAVINEVRALLRLPLSHTARQVHGLPDIKRYLNGEQSLKETIAVWQQRVRHYARRQLIWFRRTPQLRWIGIPDEEKSWQTAQRLLELIPAPSDSPVTVTS